MDGASIYRIVRSIVLPISVPGLVATFLIVLIFAWNEFLIALVLTSANAQTMPLQVAAQNATRGPQWWAMSVLILIMITPVVVMADRPRAVHHPGHPRRRAEGLSRWPTITALDVVDVRFPTSRSLDGSDAMNPDPDYSAAYVIVRTDAADGLEGHGLTFTIGRGTEVVVAGVRRPPAARRRPFDRGARSADMGGFWRALVGDSQLRWIGPEKGVIHLATAAVVNAVWDLYAKRGGQAALAAARRHDTGGDRRPRRLPVHRRRPDAGRGARAMLRARSRPRRPSAEAELLRDGYPAYTTSVGWLGYDDDKIRRLCREALAEGWTRFKLKVGADVEDDAPAGADRPRGDRTGADAGGGRQPALGRRRGDRLDGPARAGSTRTGSRSRPARTTSSATPRSPGPSRRSAWRPASTSTTG